MLSLLLPARDRLRCLNCTADLQDGKALCAVTLGVHCLPACTMGDHRIATSMIMLLVEEQLRGISKVAWPSACT